MRGAHYEVENSSTSLHPRFIRFCPCGGNSRVDTGEPTIYGNKNWSTGVAIAGEFALSDAYTLESIRTHMTRVASTGVNTASILANSISDLPDSSVVLYTQTFTTTAAAPEYEIYRDRHSGLNWELSACTDWVECKPGLAFGRLGGQVQNELAKSTWHETATTSQDIAVVINATLTEVPLQLPPGSLVAVRYSKS